MRHFRRVTQRKQKGTWTSTGELLTFATTKQKRNPWKDGEGAQGQSLLKVTQDVSMDNGSGNAEAIGDLPTSGFRHCQ
jgi:hypothetical protein